MESDIMTLRFDVQVAERTKRAMQYVKEHEANLEPRTITIELRKEDNFLSEASRSGTDLKWYLMSQKSEAAQARGLAHSPTSSQAWASASLFTTPNTLWPTR